MLDLRQVSKYYQTRTGSRQVLNNINLRVSKSERVGILGRNGAGKSTLIRLIGGSELPTSGTIERSMSVSWPLAFSGGFQGSLTGLDNLRFVCRIYSVSYSDVVPFVEDFTELGRYLREPVKTYSNGMRARLAFALSMAVDFDCFLIDEVLAVGDANFQEKCRQELFVNRKNRAMLMVAHDASMIREHCSRACVLENGVLRNFDDVNTAYDYYHDELRSSNTRYSLSLSVLEHPTTNAINTLLENTNITSLNSDTDQLGPNMSFDNQNERIVTAFYRQLLGREPDAIGLRTHSNWMQQHGGEDAVQDLLKMFLANDECRQYLARQDMSRLVGLSAEKAQAFDSIVSLGTHCYTATFLKRFQLKKFSSAFDWIFSNPSMIAHVIDDDFETFLDATQYSPVPIEQRRDGTDVNRVQHSYYKQAHGVDFMFNHHDVHEPKDYAYLTRCVERFRSALRDNAKTLFLLLRRETEHSIREFELIRDALQRKNEDVSFMFVAVANTPTHTGVARMDVLARDQNAVLSRFSGTSHWRTLDFVDPFDEFCLLRAILSNFSPTSKPN